MCSEKISKLNYYTLNRTLDPEKDYRIVDTQKLTS
jgi:hypothetical protein